MSWAGVATGVNICFIKKSSNNIKFVVNPQINGPSILSDQESYYVSNIPAGAKIKWTYTFTSSSSSHFLHQLGNPITFVSGDSTSYVTIKRGKYPMRKVDPIVPRDSSITMLKSTQASALSGELVWVYFTGTANLKCTITSGGHSYTIIKTISLSTPSSTSAPAKIQIKDADDMQTEELSQNEENAEEYKIICNNPIYSGTAFVQIKHLINNEDVGVEKNYTIELWNEKFGLVKKQTDNLSSITLDCNNLSIGLYQLLLKIDGNIVDTQKVLIY